MTTLSLFAEALGAGWKDLPEPLRDMHNVETAQAATGEACVTRGKHPAARLVCVFFGFPKAAESVAVRVSMNRTKTGEHWVREFGGQCFKSRLSRSGPGHVFEKFGPFRFLLVVTWDGEALTLQVCKGWLGPIKLPSWALPRSAAREYVAAGRFAFDVPIALPGIGLIVRYQGWLTPEEQGVDRLERDVAAVL